MMKSLKNKALFLYEKLIPTISKDESIEMFASSFIRDINNSEMNFSLEDKTDIIALIQKKQFEILENKASSIEEIHNEMDRLTILSTND